MSRFKSRTDLEELNKRMGSRPQAQKLSYQLAITKRINCTLVRRGSPMQLLWFDHGVMVETYDAHFLKYWASRADRKNWWPARMTIPDHDLPRLLAYIAATGGVRACKIK